MAEARAEPGWGVALAAAVAVALWRAVELAASPLNLSFDEAQYWSWALEPAWGYFSKPPLVAWAIAATTALFGDGEWAVRLGSPLAHAGTGLALFALVRRIADGRAALVAMLLFLTLPGVTVSAMLISTDPFLMCAWGWALLALYAALSAETEGRPALPAWLGLGLAIGLGMLAKYAMIAFVGGMLVATLWVPEWRRVWLRPGPWLALGLAAAVFAPNVLWNAANGFVSFHHTQANANLGDSGFHPGNGLAFFGAQFGVFGPIPFAVLLLLIWVALRRPAEVSRDTRFLAAFVLPILAVMTFEGFLSRANANWSAPAYVAGSAWVAVALWPGRQVWIKAAVAIHLAAALVLLNFDGIAQAVGFELTARTDPIKRVRGWDRLGAALARTLAPDVAAGAVLAFDERKTLTPMLYYLPQPQPPLAKWNPDGAIDDHYDLTADLKNYLGREVVLATRSDDVSAFAPAFSGPVRGPVTVSVPIHKDYAIRLNLYRMGKFTGYPGSAR